MKEKSAGAVIFRKQGKKISYLLLLYEAGHWDFVKGKVERGEEEKYTINREADEETGIKDLVFVPGFKERIAYFYKRDGNTISKEVIFYLAGTKTKEVKMSFEHKGFKWLEFDKALKQLTYENAKNILKKADKFLREKARQKSIEDFEK